jgi:hypothetical protein
MKTLLSSVLLFSSMFAASAAETPAAQPASNELHCFELRTYYAAPGKLDALNARFREHTMKLFEKHGLTSIGYWMPLENTNNQLIYLLGYPNREAATQAWREFSSDPEWQKVVRETEANGRLTTNIESIYLTPTAFSPAIGVMTSPESRTFELRTYKTPTGKLPALQARFRDYTVALFRKHGMGQFGYFTPMDKNKGAENTLIYILVHKNREAADAAFAEFRADPEWVTARTESEKDGALTLPAPDGVKSVFMKPTDYSPTK